MSTAMIIVVLMLLGLLIVFIHDKLQREHTILRNYPVIGHFRYIATAAGAYMRQYHYLPDWAERPFNRLERNWVNRSSRGLSNLISFGSETSPTYAFRNAPFPVLDEEKHGYPGKQIGVAEGPGASKPYMPKSFFNISGMSYGALSHAAVTSLSRGAKMAGIWMATGEGGLSRYHLEGGADLIMQIGTAKYGVRNDDGTLSEDRLRTIAAYEQVRMFEVKLAQGAKPGKGGILPGHKVTAEIARIRGIPVGKDSISPNRHLDIGNIKELGEFVNRVRTVTGKPVGVKTVAGQPKFFDDWMHDCVQHPEHCPDYIQIDGGEGGSGAAPAALAEYVGLPIAEALPLLVDARDRHGLKDRIRIFASGKLITPDKVAWALCMGADFAVSARGFMFALGCIQSLKCSSGNCPTGVTSSDVRLIKGHDTTDKAQRVMRYAKRVHEEVEIISHSCGAADPSELEPHHVTMIKIGVNDMRTPNT